MEENIRIIKSNILNTLDLEDFKKPIYSINGFYKIHANNGMTLYCFKSIIYKFDFPGSFSLKYKWENYKYESTKTLDVDISRKLDDIFTKMAIPVSECGFLGKIKFWIMFYKNGLIHKFTERLTGKY